MHGTTRNSDSIIKLIFHSIYVFKNKIEVLFRFEIVNIKGPSCTNYYKTQIMK
jgi:hypothetical protein